MRTPPDLFGDVWGSPGGKNYHVTLGQNATYYVDEHETGHKTKRVIDGGDDLARGVRITYLLDEDAAGTASLMISDAAGNEIDTFSSDIPTDKKDRDGLYITANAGMNVFQWPMTHRAGVKMTGTDFHGRPPGPLALPGTYQVTLAVGDWSMTQTFDLIKDPRVTTSDADLVQQFELMSSIQDKLSETATAVNTIRSLRGQLESWAQRLAGNGAASDLLADAAAFGERLTEFENELVQVEFTSEGDSLNHLEQLFEKLTALAPVVSSADTRPTVQSHQVFTKLAGQIDERLAAFDVAVGEGLGTINAGLAELGVDIIGVPAE